MRRADNIATFMCRLSRNSASSKGLSRPREGHLSPASLQKAVSWIPVTRYGSRFADNCRGTRLSRGGTSIGYLIYLLTPWSRVLLEKLTSKLCS